MSRKLKPFYRVEGRRRVPPGYSSSGRWMSWCPLGGAFAISKLETAQKLYKTALRNYWVEEARLVKVTYQEIAKRRRKAVGHE